VPERTVWRCRQLAWALSPYHAAVVGGIRDAQVEVDLESICEPRSIWTRAPGRATSVPAGSRKDNVAHAFVEMLHRGLGNAEQQASPARHALQVVQQRCCAPTNRAACDSKNRATSWDWCRLPTALPSSSAISVNQRPSRYPRRPLKRWPSSRTSSQSPAPTSVPPAVWIVKRSSRRFERAGWSSTPRFGGRGPTGLSDHHAHVPAAVCAELAKRSPAYGTAASALRRPAS
jgi:hypothetical protein